MTENKDKVNKDKVIFIDVDGVLLDYNRAYAEQFNKVFGTNHQLTEPYAYTYYRMYGIPKLGVDSINKLEASKTEDFWGNIPALSPIDTLLTLNSLKAWGWEVIALSKSPTEYTEARRANLVKLFGDIFLDVICIGKDGDKADVVNNYAANDKIVVDDFYPYLKNVDTNKVKVIVLNRAPHATDNPNKNLEGIIAIPKIQYLLYYVGDYYST